MDEHTMQLLLFIVLAVGGIASVILTITLYMRSVSREINDKYAEHSRQRRRDYQKERLRITLTGLVTLVVITLMIVGINYIL